MIAAAALSLALVTHDAAPLRAAANDNAPTQAQLWPGDALEVRGERLGWLQVWDHRRERPGYIRGSHVRPISTDAAKASFGAFRTDAAWTAAKTASEAKGGGSLTEPDGVKSVFMKATDYSPLK